jgi:hypothetical protein
MLSTDVVEKKEVQLKREIPRHDSLNATRQNV